MTRLKELPQIEKVPKKMKSIFDSIAKLTDEFSQKHLNDEYSILLRKLIAALCRKRPSPLLKGNIRTWAAGMIHALGMANFLFDDSQIPHIPSKTIINYFDLAKSTMSRKSKQIRETMDISQCNPNLMLSKVIEKNPLIWMIAFNGCIVDIRSLTKEVQEEAFKKGLIPYVPE